MTDNGEQTTGNQRWLATAQEGVIAGYVGGRLVGLLIYGEPTAAVLRAIPLRELAAGKGLAPIATDWDHPPTTDEVERDRGLTWSAQRMADHLTTPEMLARIPGESPDDFYRRIGSAYTYLSRVTRKPTAVLAERAGVNYSTAAKWVYECRRRGILPQTSPGKASK